MDNRCTGVHELCKSENSRAALFIFSLMRSCGTVGLERVVNVASWQMITGNYRCYQPFQAEFPTISTDIASTRLVVLGLNF
jgi:hypothetical protein